MTVPQIKIKVLPKSVLKGKMDVRFPGKVTAQSPILLDKTGGNFGFGLDLDALNLIYLPRETISPGTAGNLAFYNSTTSTIGPDVFANVTNGDLALGLNGYQPGTLTLNGSTSGSVKLQPNSATPSGTLTLPSATDQLVGRATTDTLTNKSLVSPVITSGATVISGLFTVGAGAFPPATTIGISSNNAKAASSTFDGFNVTSNDSYATQLVAEFVMATDPTAGNRRLKIDMVEQGVAWRNVSLCESGGAVAIGMANGLVTAGYSLDAASGLRSGGAISSASPTSGIGYTTGAGGTVAQATNKATGVTLNKASGQITMNAAALAAATIVSFVLTDSAIAATDVLILNHISGGTPGAYSLNARCAAGSATIDVRNNTAGSLSEAIVLQFALIKGVNA